MHEIERFGGRRIETDRNGMLKVQFDTEANMDRWLRMMRCYYNTDQFQPFVNRERLTVVY